MCERVNARIATYQIVVGLCCNLSDIKVTNTQNSEYDYSHESLFTTKTFKVVVGKKKGSMKVESHVLARQRETTGYKEKASGDRP